MTSSKLIANAVTILAVAMLFGTMLFHEKDWWPQGLKNENTYLSGVVAGVLLLLAIYISRVSWTALKNMTDRWISHNMTFRINPNDFVGTAGPSVVHRIGGINVPSWGITWPGREGALVVPEDAVVPFGRSAVLQGEFKRTPYRELDPDVRNLVDAEKVSGPYWVCYAAHHVETRGKDWTSQVRKWRLENAGKHDEMLGLRRALQTSEFASRVSRRQVEKLTQPKATGWIQGLFKDDQKADSSFDDAHDKN